MKKNLLYITTAFALIGAGNSHAVLPTETDLPRSSVKQVLKADDQLETLKKMATALKDDRSPVRLREFCIEADKIQAAEPTRPHYFETIMPLLSSSKVTPLDLLKVFASEKSLDDPKTPGIHCLTWTFSPYPYVVSLLVDLLLA